MRLAGRPGSRPTSASCGCRDWNINKSLPGHLGRLRERRPDILSGQGRVRCQDFGLRGARRQIVNDEGDPDPGPLDAGFPVTDVRINRDPISPRFHTAHPPPHRSNPCSLLSFPQSLHHGLRRQCWCARGLCGSGWIVRLIPRSPRCCKCRPRVRRNDTRTKGLSRLGQPVRQRAERAESRGSWAAGRTSSGRQRSAVPGHRSSASTESRAPGAEGSEYRRQGADRAESCEPREPRTAGSTQRAAGGESRENSKQKAAGGGQEANRMMNAEGGGRCAICSRVSMYRKSVRKRTYSARSTDIQFVLLMPRRFPFAGLIGYAQAIPGEAVSLNLT